MIYSLKDLFCLIVRENQWPPSPWFSCSTWKNSTWNLSFRGLQNYSVSFSNLIYFLLPNAKIDSKIFKGFYGTASRQSTFFKNIFLIFFNCFDLMMWIIKNNFYYCPNILEISPSQFRNLLKKFNFISFLSCLWNKHAVHSYLLSLFINSRYILNLHGLRGSWFFPLLNWKKERLNI